MVFEGRDVSARSAIRAARLPDGGVEFRLWAPAAKTVEVADSASRVSLDDSRRGLAGSAPVAEARAGTQYKFRIDGDLEVPDPASAFQPEDIFGPSEVIDHRFEWKATHGAAGRGTRR